MDMRQQKLIQDDGEPTRSNFDGLFRCSEFAPTLGESGTTLFYQTGNAPRKPKHISPELTRQVVPKNSDGSEMCYYVHPAIATYEMIFA